MERLHLEKLPGEDVLLGNRIFAHYKRIIFFMGEKEFVLSFSFGKPAYLPEVGIKLSVDGSKCWVWLKHNVFTDHIQDFLPDEHIGELPSGIREAVIEAVFEELLERFDLLSGTATSVNEISFEGPRAEGEYLVSFFLTAKQSTKMTEGYLSLDRSSLELLSRLLEAVPPSFPFCWDTLPIPANIIMGKTALLVSDLRDLGKDDIILMDECPYQERQVVYLSVSPHLYFTAHLEHNALTIEELREGAMADTNSRPDGEPKPVPAIDHLTINVVFELGEKTLSLGELKAMQPGYTFDMGKDLTKPVVVRANGKIIGSGELVQVDNRVGVRLVEVFEHAGG